MNVRDYKLSILFSKKIEKLKSKELNIVIKKIEYIIKIDNLNHFKNLRYDLKKYKRVHVNNSYVILFFGDDNIVYFVDYEHHDKIYDKKMIMKYENLYFCD